MVKLTDDEAQAVVLTLLYMRQNYTGAWAFANDPEYRRQSYVSERNNDEDLFPHPDDLIRTHANDVITSMCKQLSHEGENTDGNLVDLIAETLQSPYARNILSGRTLETLRKAILTQEERTSLAAHLNTHPMACTECGKEFRGGDAGTIRSGGLACVNCVEVKFVSCKHEGCDQRIDLPASGRKFFSKKHYCEAHQLVESIPQLEDPVSVYRTALFEEAPPPNRIAWSGHLRASSPDPSSRRTPR